MFKQIALLFFLSFSLISLSQSDDINWLSWEEAIRENAKNPKPIFVDVYTDWCSWCKKMDKETFKDKTVIKYMNEHFHCVKFDAEQKEMIKYKGNKYEYTIYGKGGYNALALALLNNQPQFPYFVILNTQEQIVRRLPGYQQKSGLMSTLKSLK
jgi:thioredoxin-related protein